MLTNQTDWHEERRRGIGSSDAAAVLGLSHWKSCLELYAEKIGLGDPEEDKPDWLYWGAKLEPVIAERYMEETGRTLIDPGRTFVQWSKEYPFMCATIDREIWDDKRRLEGVLEIKTASGFKAKEWTEEPPVEYQIQIQHQMIVTGCHWGSFAVLIGGQQFLWCDVEKNEKFCDYLIQQEWEFWKRVEAKDPPPPGDPAESAHEALQRLYPKDTGETIALPGEFIDLADRLENLKATRKDAEDAIKKLENELRAAIGDASFGVLPNGVTFSLRTVPRKGYEVKATECRTLRRMKV